MLRTVFHRLVDNLEVQLGESMDYLRHILDVSMPAFLKFGMFMPLAGHRTEMSPDAYRVSRFLLGIRKRAPDDTEIVPTTINGRAGFVAYVDGRVQSAWSFRIAAGRIRNIYVVVNPEKLAHLAQGPGGNDTRP